MKVGVMTQANNLQQENNMAGKKEEVKAEAASSEGKGQGRAVTLPNGQRRIDFIRDRYYNDGVKRGDIRKEVNAMYKEGDDGQIPYQIVFAATKTEGDPRLVAAAKADKGDKSDKGDKK